MRRHRSAPRAGIRRLLLVLATVALSSCSSDTATPDDDVIDCSEPPIGACSFECQTGCDDGETCDMLPTATGELRPACARYGPVGEHEICGGADLACQKGLTCVNRAATIAPHCLAHCEVNDAMACDDDEFCEPRSPGDGIAGVCARIECTLYPNDDCPAGQNCYRSPNGRRCLDYHPAAQLGDACSDSSDCNDAQECIAEEGTVTELCRAKCVVGDAQGCPPDEQCLPVFDDAHGACWPLP
jgi:hypothetical protein